MTSDKMTRGIGALLVLPGIIFMRVTGVIFPVCEIYGPCIETKTGMKCYIPFAYAVRVETGIGVFVIVSVALLIAGNIPETLQAFGRFYQPLHSFIILCTTVIFGIYRLADNRCRRLTLPAPDNVWSYPLSFLEATDRKGVRNEYLA